MTVRPFYSSPTWVGAYWGDRYESVDECADRFVSCLVALAKVHHLLSTWFHGEGRSAAGWHALVPDHETLRALLLEGRSRAHTGLVIEDFGYTVALWNRAPVSVGLGATVGSYPATVGLGNSFRLGLPPAAGDGGELYEPAVARSIMLALVDSWDPDFATWQSMELYNAQNREALWNPQVWTSREPKIGWLTYLASSEQGTADKAARVGGQPFSRGHLFALAERAEDVYVEAALKLKNILDQAGVLAPA